MKSVVAVIDWYGPYDKEAAQRAASDFDDGMRRTDRFKSTAPAGRFRLIRRHGTLNRSAPELCP